MALGRLRDMQSLDAEVKGLEEQLETRKLVDRAKGFLMDNHKMSESEAFTFIQRTAMSERQTMANVANRVVSGELSPA